MSDIIEQKCKLFNICNYKTAMCKVCPPDENFYCYSYFKKISDSIRTITKRIKEINSKENK